LSLGFSAAFGGFGSSPTVRPNTAFTYRLTYQNFRAAVQAQIGGYGVGNATNGMYQGQLGFDFGTLAAAAVSFSALVNRRPILTPDWRPKLTRCC
jgi:hypothetical protein